MVMSEPDDNIKQLSSFFRLLEIDMTEVDDYPDAFDSIRANAVDGVLIHNVYDPDSINTIVKRLEVNEPGFLKTWFPREFLSWFYGRNLNLADPDLEGYFEEAAKFNHDLDKLFPGPASIRPHLAGLLSRLDHGRPFAAPPGPGDGDYLFTTLRCHMEGGFIPPHIDYEYIRRRSYHHLRTLIQPQIISFVLTFTVPGEGGRLEIFSAQSQASMDSRPEDITQDHDMAGLQQVGIPFRPGSLCIFASSRHLHGVSPVGAQAKRWTAVSFMALSNDESTMYCWG